VDRARARRDPLAEAPEEPSSEASPDERAQAAWLAWRVHSALEQLPERERVVVELAYWGGLSQTEIASYLDVPLGTVKTRTRAGLARLSGLLEEVRP
jgi:RNA polymerase sigma-70 factor (ECF subfamily)